MIELRKILVPTDFSKGSETAYAVAQNIADIFGGVIDFIHVVPTLTYINESIRRLGVPLDMEKDVYPQIMGESEEKLEKAMNQYLKAESRGSYDVKINRRPSFAISEYAENHDYDLIVIGSKGKDETKLIRGGTTERVIRRSKVPVFSVGERFDEEDIKNVLITTDSSDMSFVSFPLAVAIADAFNARLTLMHVVELYGTISEELPKNPKQNELISIYEGLIERINHFLIEKGFENIYIQRTGVTYEDEVIITDGEDSRSIQLSTKIEKGISAHYEIEAYASENADLIIMATHGHSGFSHLILGSTAEKVAQYVKKPIITIRPNEEDFEE